MASSATRYPTLTACFTSDPMTMVTGEITVAENIDRETVVQRVPKDIGLDSVVGDLNSVDSKGLNHRCCEELSRKLDYDKDGNKVSDGVLDACLSSNPKSKRACETCVHRPSVPTADRRIVPELIPESDREFFFDPQITAYYLHNKVPTPSMVMMEGEINIVLIIDIAAAATTAFTAFTAKAIHHLKEKRYTISVDDKRHARMIYTRKTGGMDLQKEKPGLATEFQTDALLNIMPERQATPFQAAMVMDDTDTSGDTIGFSMRWRPATTNAGSGASSSARPHQREDERDRWRVFGYDFHQQRGLRKPHCHESSHKIQETIQQQRCALQSPWPRRLLTYMAP